MNQPQLSYERGACQLKRNRYGSVDIRDGLIPAGFTLCDELPLSEFDLNRVGVEFAPALLGFREGRPQQAWLIASDWERAIAKQGDAKLAREMRRVNIISRARRLGLRNSQINQILERRGYGGDEDLLPDEETALIRKRKESTRGTYQRIS